MDKKEFDLRFGGDLIDLSPLKKEKGREVGFLIEINHQPFNTELSRLLNILKDNSRTNKEKLKPHKIYLSMKNLSSYEIVEEYVTADKISRIDSLLKMKDVKFYLIDVSTELQKENLKQEVTMYDFMNTVQFSYRNDITLYL